MKSATFGSRLELGLGCLGLVTALVAMVVPTSASATVMMYGNNSTPACTVDSDDRRVVGGKNVGSCSPATSEGGIGEILNRNPLRQTLDQLNGYFGSQNPGGPVQAYQRRTGSTERNSGTALALFLDRQNGADMAAGYTPRETTGEFIQRWLQPLRDHNVNAWSNVSWASPRDNHRPTRYDSDIWTLTAGADMPIVNEDLIFGVFGSFTHSDVDTTFNRGDVESKLGTVGPYFVYTLTDFLSFDTSVAGIFGQNENVIGSAVAGARDVRGEQEVEGFFISMNANANYWMGNWGVQGRVGFLHSDVETESYDLGPTIAAGALGVGSPAIRPVRVPGTNNELTQFSLAAQVNHFYDKGLPHFRAVKAMPFFRVTLNYDLDHENIQLPFGTPQHPNDKEEVVLNWGVTLFGDGPFSGTIDAGKTLARENFEAWSVAGTLSYAF